MKKLKIWKKKKGVKTGDLAEILGVSAGWLSTLLNQPEEFKERRCSYEVALKVELLTKGKVKVQDMMISPQQLKDLRREIGQKRRYVARI